MYLREVQDVQDIGIDDPSGNGIIPILSESVHFNETGEYPSGYWGIDGDEPWLQYHKSVFLNQHGDPPLIWSF